MMVRHYSLSCSWQQCSSNMAVHRKVHFTSTNRQSFLPRSRRIAIFCQGWFEFNSDLSAQSAERIHSGDFKVLSHLKELGAGDLLCKPKAVNFRGCINESYKITCTQGDYFVKINRSFKAADLFAGEYEGSKRYGMVDSSVNSYVPCLCNH
ncbi:hypothetical protein KP509_04G059300 [Ceratopteris richardii]|uniref:Uncharacterized protein n=1 Tax=Ceratopteris richardii TaxID=49495 RepID=A0A8T2UVV5_CERRI|nr:hypothetical protein KP509_04G059300 [Ceratopteris richardii]KAH7439403.1 hypothetical protein KP509_04G059300 [Ceratopteris richardii]